MARRYYRRRRRRQDPTITMISVIGLLALAYLASLPAEKLQLLITAVVLIVCTFFAVTFFIKYKIRQRELKKLRALEVIDADYMDGLAFEKYVAELLKNQGYKKVALTERYDLGVDIIATKDGSRWGVQVKRYSNMVKAEAVRQVVTALNKYNCQRAMVVTNSTFSRPAKVLAESNDCILISKDELAEWIIAFQEGR
jgi:restriction system protein